MTDNDRDRGVLAPVDRKFLTGEKEYDHRQSAYNRRGQIRDRIENGLLDFSIIAEELDATERTKIFGAGRPREEHRDLERGMANLIRFLYLGLGRSRFEQVLREGVQEAEVDLGTTEIPQTTNVNLDVDPQQNYDLAETAQQIEDQAWEDMGQSAAIGFLRFATQTPGFDANEILEQVHEAGSGGHSPDREDDALEE